MRKSRIWVSQNLPKIVPKCSQSRCPKVHEFFNDFCFKKLRCASANIDFVSVFTILLACRTLFFESVFSCNFDPKNLSQTFPKRGPNPSKIDAKNVLFFNIDFVMFVFDFGASWASKLEPSWLFWTLKTYGDAPFLPS